MRGTDDEDDSIVSHLQEFYPIRLLNSIINRVTEVDWKEFLPRVYFFGIILFILGMTPLIVLYVFLFLQNSGVGAYSIVWNALGGLSIILLVILFIVVMFTEAVDTVNEGLPETPESKQTDERFVNIISGILGGSMIVLAIFFRVLTVQNVPPDFLSSSVILQSTLEWFIVLVLTLSIDFTYIGMLLIGIGLAARGVYPAPDIESSDQSSEEDMSNIGEKQQGTLAQFDETPDKPYPILSRAFRLSSGGA